MRDPNGVSITRTFDVLRRLNSINYGNPSGTSDVKFAYDVLGNSITHPEATLNGFWEGSPLELKSIDG